MEQEEPEIDAGAAARLSSNRTSAPAEQAQALKEMEALVYRLKSPYIGERMEAEQELHDLGPAAVDRLVALIAREFHKQRKRRRIYFGLVAGFCLTFLPAGIYCIVMSIVLGAHGNPAAGAYGGAVGGLWGGGGGGILGGFAWLLAPTPLQYIAANALTRIEDKRAVGALAQVLEPQPASVASTKWLSRWPAFRATTFYADLRYSAAEVLMKLLPRLESEDADLLDRDQRACLHRALLRCDRDKEAQFMIVIAQALERIGDTGAIPAVQQIAKVTPKTPAEQEVQYVAQSALEALQAKLELARTAETLLRPAGSPGAPGTTLLRPAQGASESDPAVLLRPSASDDPT